MAKPPVFQAHPWHGIPAYASQDVVHVYVEIVPGDSVKYELDKASGHLKLDRPQKFSSLCPTLYGFVPQTYCGSKVAMRTKLKDIQGDGDPLDICLITENHIAQGGLLMRGRPIGGLRMIDGDQADDKIIAVLDGDVTFGGIRDLKELPPGVIERLEHYFLSYKQPPGSGPAPKVRIAERYDKAEAKEVIVASIEDYAMLMDS